LLWRVRHRLLVTWIFVGVVPIILICVLIVQGLYILMGQVVSYMTTNEIVRQSELVRSTAQSLAWSLSHTTSQATLPMQTEVFIRETTEARHFQTGAVVRTRGGMFAVPADGLFRNIPDWSKPDFVGLVKDKDHHYIAAHVARDNSSETTEVFVYQDAPAELFKDLMPGVATVLPVEGRANAR